jgi:hypothetical protein
MRVNLQYSVELDEVPENIMDLIKTASELMHEIGENNLHADVQGLMQNNNFRDALISISDLRKILMKLDRRLDDCMRMMAGYQQIMSNPSNFLPQQSDEHELDHNIADPASELSDQIRNLQLGKPIAEGGFE